MLDNASGLLDRLRPGPVVEKEDTVEKVDNVWDFFDKFYCISLKEREDRRRSARGEFLKVGLADRVEFVLGDRLPYDIEQQIYESHMACLRKGLESGAQSVVIFEDDVEFERFDRKRLSNCIQFLRRHPDWKVLLLGALIRSSSKTDHPCVQRVRYQSLTHAYALNRSYAQQLAYEPWTGIVNDTLFRSLTEGIYALYPMCAFQKDFKSDNDKYPTLERVRRLLGGLNQIQKGFEFYSRHKFGIYAVQAAAILIVLFAFIER